MAHSDAGPAPGPLIRGYRMRGGLTRSELAGRAGISVRGLRDPESGRSNRPHLASVRRLTEALALAQLEITVGVLGPLEIRRDGHRKGPGAPKLRNLLGMLAPYTPDPVPTGGIMAHLCDARPPDGRIGAARAAEPLTVRDLADRCPGLRSRSWWWPRTRRRGPTGRWPGWPPS